MVEAEHLVERDAGGDAIGSHVHHNLVDHVNVAEDLQPLGQGNDRPSSVRATISAPSVICFGCTSTTEEVYSVTTRSG